MRKIVVTEHVRDESLKDLIKVVSKEVSTKGDNLIYNGSFEKDTEGWEVVEKNEQAPEDVITSISTEKVSDGNKSLKVYLSYNAQGEQFNLIQNVKVEGGKTYVLSFDVLTDSPYGIDLIVDAEFYRDGSLIYSRRVSEIKNFGYALTGGNPNIFAKVRCLINVPSNANQIRLYIKLYKTNKGYDGTIYFDNFELRESVEIKQIPFTYKFASFDSSGKATIEFPNQISERVSIFVCYFGSTTQTTGLKVDVVFLHPGYYDAGPSLLLSETQTKYIDDEEYPGGSTFRFFISYFDVKNYPFFDRIRIKLSNGTSGAFYLVGLAFY